MSCSRIRSPIMVAVVIFAMTSSPAFAQTPTSAANPEIVTILDVTLTSELLEPRFAGVARLTFPPGAHIIGGAIAGQRFFLIETGHFEITADSPAAIHRQGNTNHIEVIDSRNSGFAEAGDLVIVDGNPPFMVMNTGNTPAFLLDIVIWPPVEEIVRPFVTEYGVIFEPLVIGELGDLPAAPVSLQLQRITLAREATLPFTLHHGPVLVYVETGRLGVHAEADGVAYSSAASNAPGSVAGRLRVLEPGRDTVLTAGGSLVLQTGASGVLANLGRNQLDLLQLALTTEL